MLSWPHDQAVHNSYSSFLCCSGVSKKKQGPLYLVMKIQRITSFRSFLSKKMFAKKISLLFYLAFLNIQVRSRVHHLGITSSRGHIFCRRQESQNSRPRRRGLDEEGSCARLVKEKNSCLQQVGIIIRSVIIIMVKK